MENLKGIETKQAWLIAPGKFEFKKALIAPASNEILVKVAVCGLCNWEMNHWKGLLGTYPQTVGHEVAGTVVELGSDVPKETFAEGDKVAGWVNMTGFADYAVMDYRYCMKSHLQNPPKRGRTVLTLTFRKTSLFIH